VGGDWILVLGRLGISVRRGVIESPIYIAGVSKGAVGGAFAASACRTKRRESVFSVSESETESAWVSALGFSARFSLSLVVSSSFF